MTIIEALKITQSVSPNARRFAVTLACGFTPLHLQTFLAAHLQQALPDRKVTIATGQFGDVAGTLEGLAAATPGGVVIALEWPDLDLRLDYRSSGSWGPEAAGDIVVTARLMLERIASALLRMPAGLPLALSLPTIPWPPVFPTPGWQASAHELQLSAEVERFAAEVSQKRAVIVVNRQRLAEESPADQRLDLKSDLYTGLPYTMQHADRLASQLALALLPPAPRKGIISDLDDTLWSGIVGEIGPEVVSWDLTGHAQLHGLYQKLLGSLAGAGTLIGIVSKNDPAIVAKALERKDLLLRPEQVFPIEVHWNAKSGSVARILQTWNVAADSVIFVDDSPMELAEVAAAHPGVECILFPKDDHSACLAMLRRLRDLCGKESVSHDDALRLESIRQSTAFREHVSSGATPETFLQQMGAAMTIDFGAADEPRVLELVNKTNQFNLNGRRYTEGEWRKLISQPGAVLAAIAYEDKFGPLGTIAVVAGRAEGRCFTVETWVMSCRAFARRIEHQTLKMLFENSAADDIRFRCTATARNAPLREFFTAFLDEEPQSDFSLRRSQFEAKCPALYHQVRETRRAATNG